MLVKELVEGIKKLSRGLPHIKIMNLCGSHEHTVSKAGLRSILPDNIELIPGPGCPVCVCSEEDIGAAIELSNQDDNIVATFGDMIRVPTGFGSLRDNGRNVKLITSPMEILNLCQKYPEKNIIFFAVGFETTTAPVASVFLNNPPKNLFLLPALKQTPPILRHIIDNFGVNIDGLIAPGHVSAIIGAKSWRYVADEYGISTVVSGFEVEDVLASIYMILKFKKEGKVGFANTYKRVVKYDGNKKALSIINEVFSVDSVSWRGIGYVPKSGYVLKEKYKHMDAMSAFRIEPRIQKEQEKGCICADIVIGKAYPSDCPLFKKACNPSHPKGPCMVSYEGACFIWYSSGK